MNQELFDGRPVRVVAENLRFPEGPVAFSDGSVVVCEIEGGSLALVSADGATKRIRVGGGANGAAIGPDRAIYVCNDGGLEFTTDDGIRHPTGLAVDNRGGYVQRVDLATGAVETIFTHCGDREIGSLNDIVFDATGCCYIVDTTVGAVYYTNPRDRSIRIADATLQFPNGMGLAPEGTKLYVSETYSGRIFQFDVAEPGELVNKTEIYSSNGENHLDGLAVDGVGNVCVANLQRSGISVIDPEGELVAEFVTPEPDPFVTNICFLGDTAYICSSGRGILYAVEWPWPGLPLHFGQ